MNWGQTNTKIGRNKGVVDFPIFMSHFSFPLPPSPPTNLRFPTSFKVFVVIGTYVDI